MGIEEGGVCGASAEDGEIVAFSSDDLGFEHPVNSGGKVVASAGYDVQHTTYTLAPGGDTGWRTGPGSTTLAVTKGALKLTQAEGCASRDLAAGT